MLKLLAFTKDMESQDSPIREFGPQISKALVTLFKANPTASIDIALVPPEALSKVVGWVEVMEGREG